MEKEMDYDHVGSSVSTSIPVINLPQSYQSEEGYLQPIVGLGGLGDMDLHT
ncbi:hypothetical protein CHUAL_013544 [Chamberlinius hualienensis]